MPEPTSEGRFPRHTSGPGPGEAFAAHSGSETGRPNGRSPIGLWLLTGEIIGLKQSLRSRHDGLDERSTTRRAPPKPITAALRSRREPRSQLAVFESSGAQSYQHTAGQSDDDDRKGTLTAQSRSSSARSSISRAASSTMSATPTPYATPIQVRAPADGPPSRRSPPPPPKGFPTHSGADERSRLKHCPSHQHECGSAR